MSGLRKHLQDEKARHQGFVYPGNLAADILGAPKVKPASVMDYADAALRRRSPVWRWVAALGTLAAAAAVALFIYLHHEPAKVTQPRELAQQTTEDEHIPIAPEATASINDIEAPSIVPSDVDSLVPTYESMSFPTVPSMSDLSTDTTQTPQTSQEST